MARLAILAQIAFKRVRRAVFCRRFLSPVQRGAEKKDQSHWYTARTRTLHCETRELVFSCSGSNSVFDLSIKFRTPIRLCIAGILENTLQDWAPKSKLPALDLSWDTGASVPSCVVSACPIFGWTRRTLYTLKIVRTGESGSVNT